MPKAEVSTQGNTPHRVMFAEKSAEGPRRCRSTRDGSLAHTPKSCTTSFCSDEVGEWTLAQLGVQGATVGEKVDIEVDSVASESNAEATDDVAQAIAEVAEEAQTGSVGPEHTVLLADTKASEVRFKRMTRAASKLLRAPQTPRSKLCEKMRGVTVGGVPGFKGSTN